MTRAIRDAIDSARLIGALNEMCYRLENVYQSVFYRGLFAALCRELTFSTFSQFEFKIYLLIINKKKSERATETAENKKEMKKQ